MMAPRVNSACPGAGDASLLHPLVAYFDITGLSGAAELDMSFIDDRSALDARAGAHFRGVTGEHPVASFHGSDIDVELTGWPIMKTREPAQAQWRLVESGVLLDDVAVASDLSLDVVAREFHAADVPIAARIFDGVVRSRPFAIDLGTLTGLMYVDVDRVSLAQIFELEGHDFVSEGYLSGSVPVQMKGGEFSVSEGMLHAELPGGFMRYQPDTAIAAFAEDNAQMQFALDALNDFRFHGMEIALDYEAAGNRVARTALRGNNSSFQDGRDVNLNVSVEENVGTLLRSLRVADDLSDRIDRKLSGK